MGGVLTGERWACESRAPERLKLSAMRFYAIKKLVDVFDPRGVAKTLEDMRRAEQAKKKLAKAQAKAEAKKGPRELKLRKSRMYVYDSEDEINGHLVWTRKNRLRREEKARREEREKLMAMLKEAEKRKRKMIPFCFWCACRDAFEENAEGRFSDLLETESDRKSEAHWSQFKSREHEEKELRQALSELDKEISSRSAELGEEEDRRITSFLPKTAQSSTACGLPPPTSPADSAMCVDEESTDVNMTGDCAMSTLASAEAGTSESKEWGKISPFPVNAVVKAARLKGKPKDGKSAEKQYDELVNGAGMAGSNLDLEMCS